MKYLNEFKSLVEEEKKDYSKFDALVRAGLANKAQMNRIHKILDKMGDEKPNFSPADRAIIQNIFNKMVDLLSSNKNINMQARRAVKEESLNELTGMGGIPGGMFEHEPPFVLVLRRKAIRLYPDNTKVALYFNDRIKKYFSVPFGTNVNAVLNPEEFISKLENAYELQENVDHTLNDGNLISLNAEDCGELLKVFYSLTENNQHQFITNLTNTQDSFNKIYEFCKSTN